MNIKHADFFLILIVCVYSCSTHKNKATHRSPQKPDHQKNYAADVQPAYDITFTRTQSFGSTEEDFVMVGGASGDLVRVDGKGRVFIPDRQQNIIHVFAPDGHYVTHMGGKGKGPGEVQIISSIRMGPKNVYIYDNILERIQVFSLDRLAFAHTINMDPQNWKHIKNARATLPTGDFFIRKDGTLFVRFSPTFPGNLADRDNPDVQKKNRYHFYYMDAKGSVISNEILKQKARRWTVGTFHGGPATFKLPIYGEPLIAISDDGMIFSAWSEDFLITTYNPAGSRQKAWHYAFKKSPLHRAELVKQFDQGFDFQLDIVKSIDLPDTWPALHSMQLDDEGRLWVATIGDDRSVYQWWLLDTDDGHLLARFTWPRDKYIEEIKKGNVYTSERNKEGVARIVRYDIQLQPNKN